MNNKFALGAIVYVLLVGGEVVLAKVSAVRSDRRGRVSYDFEGRGDSEWVSEDRVFDTFAKARPPVVKAKAK